MAAFSGHPDRRAGGSELDTLAYSRSEPEDKTSGFFFVKTLVCKHYEK